METNDETVKKIVQMLAELRESQAAITSEQMAELRQAAEWLMPKPPPPDRGVTGVRVHFPNPRRQ